jgi:CheY-like chemotaxis protein
MKSLRVLIIEDNALISLMLSQMLAGMGHHVCASAGSEAEAVTAATRYRPDVMIVDGTLGQGSGISAVDEILLAGPVAHVFVSGDPGGIQARRPGAVVVRKPFREAELAKAIEIVLQAAGDC